MKKLTLLFASLLIITACAVGPRYKRPNVDIPGTYRGAAAEGDGTQTQQGSSTTPPQEAAQASTQSFGDQKWWDVFQDPQLQDLIRTALKNNYDVQIAAARILEAQARLGITRADQLPSLGAGASGLNNRSPKWNTPICPGRNCQNSTVPSNQSDVDAVSASLSWDLDFWGKYRSATKAARANLVATEWARRAIISTLVSNVAASYFQLRADDLQLEISRNTLTTRQESLQLTRTLSEGGAGTELDVRQAEQLVATAAEEIPDLERRIQQEENFISTLLGKNPGPIARGMKLTEQPHLPEVPAGIPSRLLERRPDIRQAEEQLIAANAQIGVARAVYFPQISLTGDAGFLSQGVTSLFTGPAGFWTLGGSLTQPIFAGGRIKSGVRLSEARKQEMVLTYQQTIQQAFRGVSDSLVGYQKNREFRQHQEELVVAAQDAARLSEARYRGGATNYLEVLTNETNAFNAELGLAQAQLNELVSLVEIYRNLGGGWES